VSTTTRDSLEERVLRHVREVFDRLPGHVRQALVDGSVCWRLVDFLPPPADSPAGTKIFAIAHDNGTTLISRQYLRRIIRRPALVRALVAHEFIGHHYRRLSGCEDYCDEQKADALCREHGFAIDALRRFVSKQKRRTQVK
jgi:hypothetical protein